MNMWVHVYANHHITTTTRFPPTNKNNSYLSAYDWARGGTLRDRNISIELPTDADLVMHVFLWRCDSLSEHRLSELDQVCVVGLSGMGRHMLICTTIGPSYKPTTPPTQPTQTIPIHSPSSSNTSSRPCPGTSPAPSAAATSSCATAPPPHTSTLSRTGTQHTEGQADGWMDGRTNANHTTPNGVVLTQLFDTTTRTLRAWRQDHPPRAPG